MKIASIATLALVLLYMLFALFRQLRTAHLDSQVNALRLQSFQEKVRYLGVQASRAEEKKQGAWAGTRKFRVDKIVPEAENICSFYLVPHDGKSIPAYDPGQFLTFKLDVPGHDKPVVRCYSLSDTPLERGRYRVTIKRLGPPPKVPEAPAGVSSGYFHTVLAEGDMLDCKAPGGNFYLDMGEHTPIVLIGGGIGVTPMLSMLRSVALSGSKRETWLFYGVRHKDEVVQAAHLRELAEQYENIHVKLCFSDPRAGEDEPGRDYDYAQQVSVELMHSMLPSSNYDYYICGPAPMMTAITGDLEDAGVPKAKIHYESFGPASVRPKPVAPAADGVSHLINFAKSGRELNWTAADGPILDFAERNGIELDCGCRAGSCGSCAIAVRDGAVEYIEEISVEPEEGSCLACLAVPTQNLVIDA
ncbi:MAG: 2Fe-2S iron-sulfur cluster-binding protein [Pseudomonadota bacterium]